MPHKNCHIKISRVDGALVTFPISNSGCFNDSSSLIHLSQMIIVKPSIKGRSSPCCLESYKEYLIRWVIFVSFRTWVCFWVNCNGKASKGWYSCLWLSKFIGLMVGVRISACFHCSFSAAYRRTFVCIFSSLAYGISGVLTPGWATNQSLLNIRRTR